jgi:glycosyltransferase involved in cell wall biosynthesis
VKFWVIHAQEPLPQPLHVATRRLWRSNTIAEMLAARGHGVVRWRSGYSHYEKRYLVAGSPRVSFENLHFQYLAGPPYRRNIGIRRVIHHRALARNFAQLARSMDHVPDLIHVGNVPLELCREAVRFAEEMRIPAIVDIRDLWPDLFLDVVPEALAAFRPLVKGLLFRSFRTAAYAMAHAAAITGITEPFVDWGVRLARRKRRTDDRVFHMSYPERKSPASAAQLEALTHKLGLARGQFLICYFGSIGYQSDFETLLAAARLIGNGSPARFVICGDGPKLQSLREKASGLGNVLLPGWLEADEILHLMQLATVGLLPFKERDNYVMNMPNKFSEYLSGSLVIACGVKGEMARLVAEHDCGFTYPTGDAATLARRLTELMASPARIAGMKANSTVLFRSRFDCSVVYSELCEYLEGMANSGKSAGAGTTASVGSLGLA